MLKFLTVNNILAPSNIGTTFFFSFFLFFFFSLLLFWNPLCVPKVRVESGLKMFSSHFLGWEAGFHGVKLLMTLTPANCGACFPGGCSSHCDSFCLQVSFHSTAHCWLRPDLSVSQSSKDLPVCVLLIRVKHSSFPFLQEGQDQDSPSDVKSDSTHYFLFWLLHQSTDKTRR